MKLPSYLALSRHGVFYFRISCLIDSGGRRLCLEVDPVIGWFTLGSTSRSSLEVFNVARTLLCAVAAFGEWWT
jgi:hypothetical protein